MEKRKTCLIFVPALGLRGLTSEILEKTVEEGLKQCQTAQCQTAQCRTGAAVVTLQFETLKPSVPS